MDDRLRQIEREYTESPTLANYQAYRAALARVGLPSRFCFFCGDFEEPRFYDSMLDSCSCGALFCQDCGLDYVCGESNCRIGYRCPRCLDKCPSCNENICPGEIHETHCEICDTKYCLTCAERYLTRCSICNAKGSAVCIDEGVGCFGCMDSCNSCWNMVCSKCTDETEEEWVCVKCAATD